MPGSSDLHSSPRSQVQGGEPRLREVKQQAKVTQLPVAHVARAMFRLLNLGGKINIWGGKGQQPERHREGSQLGVGRNWAKIAK